MWGNGVIEAAHYKALASNIVEGEPGAYTLAMFYEDFPQFKKENTESEGFVPSTLMNMFIAMCNQTVSQARWEEMWRFACGLFVAHYVTAYLRQSRGNVDGSKSAAQVADSGALLGIVSSATLGDASVSYDTSNVTQATQNWGQFNLTSYGQQYASLARIYCIGGAYVI
jgi:hypothetical protein